MERFIGIDAHTASSTIAVMGTKRRIRELRVDTHGQTLVETIKGIAGNRHICFEEGTLSEWLYEVLEPLAAEVVVVQPKKREGPKSDSSDAWGLADDLRTGAVKGVVFKASRRFQALRQAVRGHQMVTQDLVRAKNRVKALFRSRGVHVEREIYKGAWPLEVVGRPLFEAMPSRSNPPKPWPNRGPARSMVPISIKRPKRLHSHHQQREQPT